MESTIKIGFILLFFLGVNLVSLAQTREGVLQSKVIDGKTGEALIGATVLNLQTGEGTVSDSIGKFSLEFKDARNIVSIQYLGYFSRSFNIEAVPKIISLEISSEVLRELTVFAERIPQDLTVRFETIKDFVISEDRLLMLSKRRGEEYILKLADLDGRVLHVQKLPNIKKIESLFTSCFATNFLVGEYEVLQLHTTQDSIFIVDKETRQRFDAFLLPCLAQTEKYIYQEKRATYNQVASIHAYDKKAKGSFVFASVNDKENLDRLHYDKKYMDYVNGTGPLYLGIHASHSKNPAVNARSAAQWGALLSRSFYLPVDYYLHPKGDTILLFDHEKHVLTKYSETGKEYAQYPIEYSKVKTWKSKDNILLDLAMDKIYAVHRNSKFVFFTLINTITAKSMEQFKVQVSFVEKMCIHNGNLYFTNSSLVPGQGARILKKVELH